MFYCIINYFFAIKKTKVGSRNIIAILTLTPIIVLIYLSGSRTGLMMLILCFLGFLWAINTRVKVYNKRFSYLYLLMICAIALFQFYLANNFNANGLLITINQILAGRVFYSYKLLSALGGIPIFHGLNIDSYMPIDFYYIQVFYSLGAISAVCFFYIIFSKLTSVKLTKSAAVVLFTCLMATATESYFMIPLYNFSLFILFSRIDRSEI